jgi:starch phosphorylase
MRLSQETVLGLGGVRVLKSLNIEPAAWHVNEGHPAFLLLERARELVQSGISFEKAVKITRATSVFTTHTPVPAGHDVFTFDLMERYFAGYWEDLGISRDEFFRVARQDQSWGPTFSMSVLGLKLAGQYNGVSKLHGEVSRKMWHFLWPDRPVDQVPIRSITNGVHTPSWLAPELRDLFDEYLPQNWMGTLGDPGIWQGVLSIPDQVLWDVRKQLRHRLVDFVRERARVYLARLGAEHWQLENASAMFDPAALTIGFARRFATYKRATLIFTQVERLKHILNQPGRPVQIIFAGKAHPADEPGKSFIREVYQRSHEPGLAGRIVFLENYDINIARYLVQGTDVWLNTPRRPNEASGTSGQKAALNGVLNFSVLDGWWTEGYNGKNGWVIGQAKTYDDPGAQDWEDSQSLYQTLEQEIVPLFYERDDQQLSHRWLAMVKEAIRSVAPTFSTTRMVQDYTRQMYLACMTNQALES